MSSSLLPGFYVVRTHSHTDRQCLWKVVSRCFPILSSLPGGQDPREFAKEAAQSWMQCASIPEEPNPDHKFAVVEVL